MRRCFSGFVKGKGAFEALCAGTDCHAREVFRNGDSNRISSFSSLYSVSLSSIELRKSLIDPRVSGVRVCISACRDVIKHGFVGFGDVFESNPKVGRVSVELISLRVRGSKKQKYSHCLSVGLCESGSNRCLLVWWCFSSWRETLIKRGRRAPEIVHMLDENNKIWFLKKYHRSLVMEPWAFKPWSQVRTIYCSQNSGIDQSNFEQSDKKIRKSELHVWKQFNLFKCSVYRPAYCLLINTSASNAHGK